MTAKQKIYVASKTKRAAYWKQLRSQGWNITSTWIDEAGRGQTRDVTELSERCINEIRDCDCLLLFVGKGDAVVGALIEAGVALAFGKPVKCVAPLYRFSIFDCHPLWESYRMVAEALESLQLNRTQNNETTQTN